MATNSNPNIVLLGGGTGSFTLLQGLKKLTPNITAIVNMSDDGGSTGVLRDEYGVLPPGDARQCLVALSETPEIRDLFSYRFDQGVMAGHTVGNLILSALEMQQGSFAKAIQVASDILRITGSVIPVTLNKHILVARDGDREYRGEHTIDGDVTLSSSTRITLEPQARLNPAAAEAIRHADMVVIAPGSVYTSLLPICAVNGMGAVLKSTDAVVICVANLVNKPGQTDGWHVADYVQQYESYLGDAVIDYVLYNNEPITPRLKARYAAEGELLVQTDAESFKTLHAQAVGAQLISQEITATKHIADTVQRSYIRHDADRVCMELQKLLSPS